ncbi:MAG: RNA polymerase sigma-70 factor [Balneolaceae bacterium]
MKDINEKLALQKLRIGDEEVYEKLYYCYHKRLYSFAFKYLKSKELAEDAVQDTFIKLWEQRRTITTSVKGFLFTAARNHVLNMIRNKKRKVLKHIELERQKINTENKTEEIILYSEYQKILAKGVEKLTEGKKEIFNLKTVHGLSNSEVANHLDITINTVKSQYYQASKFIREYLNEHADIDSKKSDSG